MRSSVSCLCRSSIPLTIAGTGLYYTRWQQNVNDLKTMIDLGLCSSEPLPVDVNEGRRGASPLAQLHVRHGPAHDRERLHAHVQPVPLENRAVIHEHERLLALHRHPVRAGDPRSEADDGVRDAEPRLVGPERGAEPREVLADPPEALVGGGDRL